ncbi:MAG: methyltransferase domain-containing protein [Caldilineales bacterium]|nr:methyltransferase domain-containing protein [Caldilineales bacterium]
MRLLCPECRQSLGDDLCCAESHCYGYENGVLRLLTNDFAAQLDEFTANVGRFRQADGARLIALEQYETLPESLAAVDFQWRLRSYDLAVVRKVAGERGGLSVLDVGAWNGWLSHRLTLLGHHVTAVDYFADVRDGLGASKYYSTRFLTIQMDLLDLGVLTQPFDLIILNRCLQFQPDPLAFVESTAALLVPDGILLALGLEFFFDSSQKQMQVDELAERVRSDFGFDLFLRPTKGYLDRRDRDRLISAGMAMHSYPRLRLANLRARLQPGRPRHEYGLLRQSSVEHSP